MKLLVKSKKSEDKTLKIIEYLPEVIDKSYLIMESDESFGFKTTKPDHNNIKITDQGSNGFIIS